MITSGCVVDVFFAHAEPELGVKIVYSNSSGILLERPNGDQIFAPTVEKIVKKAVDNDGLQLQ